MTEDDAREYRTALSTILDGHELRWIIEQAHEKITLGKVHSKRLQAQEFVPDEVGGELHRRSRRTAEFLGTEPFTEIEKLGIVLDAIELGLVSTSRMQEAMLAELLPNLDRMRFVQDDAGGPVYAFTRSEAAQRKERANRLSAAVQKIRELI